MCAHARALPRAAVCFRPSLCLPLVCRRFCDCLALNFARTDILIFQVCCVCSCVYVDTSGVCGTITVQHLLLNRNALFRCVGGSLSLCQIPRPVSWVRAEMRTERWRGQNSHNGQGGLRPHHYCLPVLKREHHRAALVAAATSGSPKVLINTPPCHSTTPPLAYQLAP